VFNFRSDAAISAVAENSASSWRSRAKSRRGGLIQQER